ncbi:hypothetical protein HYH03_002970 [Edaphochlamys debaryana]|uniref:Uncharacterized protein n=1 Tax=Edaphochlamys debaryana TaxID=47281 RepID=A0A835YB57_9CHLO|nr:hypothetical protein HYH03_002970 [Edaphochlamys debaryana]|eukprot:KAG2499396.1 hypothetical protein HYH03_002970 [Edaphochlamys debaryana]
MGAIGFAAVSFAALALTFSDAEFSSDARTTLTSASMSYTDAAGHSQAFADAVSMPDSIGYMTGWMQNLVASSETRFPKDDGLLYVAEGLEVKHMFWIGVTSPLPTCKGPAAVVVPETRPCRPQPLLTDVAAKLQAATNLTFSLASSNTVWRSWYQPIITTRLWSNGEPRANAAAALAALASADALAIAANQLVETDIYIMVKDVYDRESYAMFRLMAWMATDDPYDTPKVVTGHRAVRSAQTLPLPTKLSPVAHALTIIFFIWCGFRLFLEVMEALLHRALLGSVWRYFSFLNCLELAMLLVVTVSASMRYSLVASNSELLGRATQLGWAAMDPAADAELSQLYENGITLYILWYTWLAPTAVLAIMVFRHLNVHAGVGVFTELLSIAATPLKDLGLVIIYIIILCATINYLFFILVGSNLDLRTWGESFLTTILLALGYYDYNAFTVNNIAFSTWTPIAAFMFVLMALALVIIAQNVILAIIGVAYDKATELVRPTSGSFAWFVAKVYFFHLVWLYYWVISGFSKDGARERFMSSAWQRWSREHARAYALTCLPEMELVFTYFCDPGTLMLRRVPALEAAAAKRAAAAQAAAGGAGAGGSRRFSEGGEDDGDVEEGGGKAVRAPDAPLDVEATLDDALLREVLRRVEAQPGLLTLLWGPFGPVWHCWQTGGPSMSLLHSTISDLYLKPGADTAATSRFGSDLGSGSGRLDGASGQEFIGGEAGAGSADGRGEGGEGSSGLPSVFDSSGGMFGRGRRRQEQMAVLYGEVKRVEALLQAVLEHQAAQQQLLQQLVGGGGGGGAGGGMLGGGSMQDARQAREAPLRESES